MRFNKMSHKQRLEWLGSKVIVTPDVQKVRTFCRRLYRQSRTKNEGNGAFIIGDTGTENQPPSQHSRTRSRKNSKRSARIPSG